MSLDAQGFYRGLAVRCNGTVTFPRDENPVGFSVLDGGSSGFQPRVLSKNPPTPLSFLMDGYIFQPEWCAVVAGTFFYNRFLMLSIPSHHYFPSHVSCYPYPPTFLQCPGLPHFTFAYPSYLFLYQRPFSPVLYQPDLHQLKLIPCQCRHHPTSLASILSLSPSYYLALL